MTDTTILRPIETTYNGYRFRSRLESRWAVFLDAAGVPYSYEPEGFEISATVPPLGGIDAPPVRVQRFYLPDFWLPRQERFLEIKPAIFDEYGIAWPSDELCLLQSAFQQQTGKSLIVLCGEPGHGAWLDDDWDPERASYRGFIAGDCDYEWCECQGCGAIGLSYCGRAERNIHRSDCPRKGNYDKHYSTNTPRLRRAHDRARAHRFEHGEGRQRVSGAQP